MQRVEKASCTVAKAGDPGHKLSPWSVKDDETLIEARTRGMNWNQIAARLFPNQSPNACRKRHERLLERRDVEKWDGVRFDILSQAYMKVRKKMWNILAHQIGERWDIVEQECMEKGLKNLRQASRSAQKKQGIYGHDDSGIGISDDEPDGNPEDYNVSSASRLPPPILMSASDESLSASTSTLRSTRKHQHISFSPIREKEASVGFYETIESLPQIFETNDSAATASTKKDNIDRFLQKHAELPDRDDSSYSHQISDSIPTSSRRSEDVTVIETQSPDHHHSPCTECSLSDPSTTSEPSSNPSDNSSVIPGDTTSVKRRIVDKIMIRFYEIFESTSISSYRSHASGTPSSSTGSNSSRTHQSHSGALGKRKPKDCEGDKDDQNKEDRPNKRHKKDEELDKMLSENKRKLACPYFKYNRRKYRDRRSCPGPGWDSIHRLKEHLYRRHALPPQCQRCWRTYKDEPALTEHLRSVDACAIREQQPEEGLDKKQIEQLKSRQSMFRADDDEEKWRIIYLILFPDTPPTQLPTPYYDDGDTADDAESSSPKASDITQYEAYLRRELPRRVRKELEIAIEKMVGPIEETLKNQLEDIVRNCQERLSKTYQPGPQLCNINMGTESIENDRNSSSIHIDQFASSSSMVPAQHSVPPDTTWDPWIEIRHLLQSTEEEGSDSAYDPGLYSMQNSLPSDPYWSIPVDCSSDINLRVEKILEYGVEAQEYTGMMSDLDTRTSPLPDTETHAEYSGKGKGKMVDRAYQKEW
ncbi:hypothetical protein BS50DRAFT_621649 [Corynespora cassiicola Philippines]|uniref:Myb-like domain-containing protein n=1 Tax=Corynespora cassiicola Philippines TaxID=1448308 RepID=A0A2T2NK86_CORCC|nr:hypothetical protein BS50DRAFT_621649 [Corynespora cassiicola Philippines]